MSKSIIADVVTALDVPSAAPSGNVGINLSTSLPEYTARQRKWLVTVVVTVAPATVTLWGALGQGVVGDSTDDTWGLYNDKRGRYLAGVLGTSIPVGKQHFIVEDIGIFTRLYFQKSAGTVDVYLSAIAETDVP